MSASEMKEICLDVTGVDKELKSLPIDKALAFFAQFEVGCRWN